MPRKKCRSFGMIGFTRPHFSNHIDDECKGKSGAGKYGHSMVELDYRTGQILAALKKNGIENSAIVIWLPDNGATVTATAVDELNQGDNGPFRGELGDTYEGSIRAAGMVKWPAKIKPAKSNEMFAIHDLQPVFAKILNVDLPDDRPYDGIDQSDFLPSKQSHSNRNSLSTFISSRIAAVRWN